VLQVRFGTPHCNGAATAGSLYHFEPAALDLAPGTSGTVTISFAPWDAKDYAAEVPIFLGHGTLPAASRPGTSTAAAGSRVGSPSGGQRSSGGSSGGAATPPQQAGGPVLAPYMQLELQGLGKFAALTFDVRECVLPPVPLGESPTPGFAQCWPCSARRPLADLKRLQQSPRGAHSQQAGWHAVVPSSARCADAGVASSATFYVINNGYDNLELKVVPPQDREHAPLQVGRRCSSIDCIRQGQCL
jgi:hypothetical protein